MAFTKNNILDSIREVCGQFNENTIHDYLCSSNHTSHINLDAFISDLKKIARLTDNVKTKTHFILSLLRVHSRKIDKDGRGSSIIIETTKRCNHACPHCYSVSRDNTDMEDHVLKKILRFSYLHYKYVFLTGGEPLLDQRIFSMASQYPDLIFFFFTNGSLMSEETAYNLSLSPNLIPMLSINGDTEGLHDSLKYPGSYQEILNAIKHLNQYDIPWGFLSVITEQNAENVLSREFIRTLKTKGAIIGRYLEYLPVGEKANPELIPSGATYYLMEKRKKEIIENQEIYMQELCQEKCRGLIFFDVYGNIKNCPFFHYAKHNVNKGNIQELVADSLQDWSAASYAGECPVYSNIFEFRNYLQDRDWHYTLDGNEEYLRAPSIGAIMEKNYRDFLFLKASGNQ